MKRLLFFAAIILFNLQSANAQCSAFYDGFETGSYTPTWTTGTGTYTYSCPSGGAAVGTYNVQLAATGTNSFYQGLTTTFASSQPTYMSWYMRTNTTSAANGYVVIGNSNIATDNGIIFCYFNSTSGLRFFASTGYNHPIVANQWYHVEARNMNWTSRTCDIWVDNVMILSGWPFRSTTAMNIDRIHCFSLSASTAQYDEFIVGAQPVSATSTVTNISCFGSSDGSAAVTASGGNGTYTYSWAPSGGTAASATGLSAGIYTVTITDGTGCTGTQTVNITEPSAIASTTMQTNVSCFGGANGDAMVMPTGGTPGYTYSWSSGGTAQTVTGLAAGIYSVTITDANACTSVQTVTITEPPMLFATATNNGPVCEGSQVTMSAVAGGGTAGYTYNWLPGNLSGAVATDILSATTAYTLEVTDANGCTTSTVTVAYTYALPVVDLGADTTACGSYVLDAQNSGSTYLWSTGGTAQTETVTSTGVYYVQVTNGWGCASSDTVSVSVDAMPDAGAILLSGGNDVCVGDSVTLMSTAAGSVDWWVMPVAGPTWSYMGTGNPFSPQPPSSQDVGQHYFMAIAMNGVCPPDSSAVITVEVHDAPVIPLASDTASCSSIVLDAQNAGSSYLWNTNDTTQMITATVSGMYTVWIVDQFGCEGADSIDVTINTPPTVTGTASSNPVCMDDADVTLTGAPAGGLWTGPGVAGNMFNPSIGVGNQVLMYSYTDTNGCAGSFALTVVVNACVGMEEQPEVLANIYPNPNNGTFSVQFAQAQQNVVIEISDAEGRVVKTEQMNAVAAGSAHVITLDDAATGIYFIRVLAGENTAVFRIAVQD